MRPHPVVVPTPTLNHNLCLPQRIEHLAIEQFVTQPRVETLDIAVLPRTARRDVGRLGAERGNTLLNSFGDEFRTIVGADIPWGTTQHEQLRQQLDNIDGLEPARHPDGEAFARELIDRVEYPVLAPVMGAVLDEVIAPHMVCMLGPQTHARAVGKPQAPTLRLLGRRLEPLTPPDALHPLVVDHPAALPAQQLGDLAIAVAAIGPGQVMMSSVNSASS